MKCSFVVSGRNGCKYRVANVVFTGNTAPYHITHPSTDNDVQIVSPTVTMATVTCSLNVTIPSSVIVIWSHNTNLISPSQVSITGHSTTLLILNPQSSDTGVYQCAFNNVNNGWVLRRNIRLITSEFL